MKTYQDIKSAAYIDAIIHYVEPLLGVHFTRVKKNRYNALCPFHTDTKDTFMAYVNKQDEVRFHCFGACKGDWDIFDLIMLREKCRFRKAQQVWAEHLGIEDFKFSGGVSPCIPEPHETPEPDDTVVFIDPKRLDEKIVSALDAAAHLYNDLLMANKDRFKHIWDYLVCRGVEKNTIGKFNIGYAPPYSDEQYQGRALTTDFFPRFEKDSGVLNVFSDSGLVRCLNDKTVKGYGYYCRQVDFKRKDTVLRNYGDFLAGRIVFPIYDADACLTGLIGRRPDDKGVRRLKHQNREVPLSAGSWLYGIEKAVRHIRQYRTIILVEGIFDFFAFYNLLQNQDKTVVVSTLGSYLSPEAVNFLEGLNIKHFIVAFDWDGAGRNGIERVAAKLGGWVYYLGGLAEGQDPYDMLNPLVDTIGEFSLKHKKTEAHCTDRE